MAEKLEAMKLGQAAALVRSGVEETLSYMALPREHWTRIRTNNLLERIMRELRRRTRVVGSFPDGQSALILVAARLRHVAVTRKYLDMQRLREQKQEEQAAKRAESLRSDLVPPGGTRSAYPLQNSMRAT